MTLAKAIKEEMIIEIENDVYLTDNNRVLKYDRYYIKNKKRPMPSNMWVDEDGNVFHNFNDAFYKIGAYRWA